MEVTEKYLNDIGGWQAMKSAREYVRTSSVSEVQRDGNHFRGLMLVNGRKMRVALEIHDARRVDAKCACRTAQQGLICPHALAVALSAIQAARPELRTDAPKTERKPSLAAPVAKSSKPEVKFPSGQLEIFLSMEQWQRLPQGSIPVFLKFEPKADTSEKELGPWMVEQGIPFRSGGFRLSGPQLEVFLKHLEEHPRVFSNSPKDAKPISLAVTDHLKIRASAKADGEFFHFSLENPHFHSFEVGSSLWLWDPQSQVLAPVKRQEAEAGEWIDFFKTLVTKRASKQSREWVLRHLVSLKQQLEQDEDSDLHALKLVPYAPRFVLELDGNFRGLRAQLWVQLPHLQYVATSAKEEHHYPIQDPADPTIHYLRNLSGEQEAVRKLQRFGFKLHAHGYWEISSEREVLEFYSSKMERLAMDFEIQEGEQWKTAKRGILAIKPRLQSSQKGQTLADASRAAGQDWLSLEVDYVAPDGFRIPRNEVLRLIRSGKRDLHAGNGKRYLLDIEGCEELEESLQDADTQLEGGGARISLRTNHLAVLGDFVKDRQLLLRGDPLTDRLKPEELKRSLGKLGGILRPYQMEGIAWLEALSRFSGGGVLADEMGLGKTLQTLAFLSLQKATNSDTRKPSLIVCPTSLLYNWRDEAEKFVPHLKVHVSHDLGRKKYLDALEEFDLVLTSYALIVRDLSAYQKVEFDTLVLDEASYIRNPDTESAKAVKAIKATNRCALTGTPVENGVRDLWSIFQFALPRYLPSQDKFQERFVKPLQSANAMEGEQAREVMLRLKRLVNPYLLRRTKREVAKDLPEKIEKVLFCELSREQKEVYQRLLEEGRQEIRDARKRSGKGAARMTMFTILLRLRQVCNDLRLLKNEALKDQVGGKWEVLEETFTELVEGGHKAIIFSQFVGMLHLLKDKLDEMGISYSYLDGSSKDRAEQVSEFQKEKKTQFFLISLKAGGYGLTLTEADHVMLVDPWWNPAVEAQAIDRAHRIGQERPVTAYRVIARGTVEEKILKLQAAKRKIIDLALEDDPAVMSGVSDDELEALFED